MKLSGSLGDVMKESVGVASSYVRSTADQWGIDPVMFEKTDIHIQTVPLVVTKNYKARLLLAEINKLSL